MIGRAHWKVKQDRLCCGAAMVNINRIGKSTPPCNLHSL